MTVTATRSKTWAMQALVTHNRNSYSVAIEFRRSVAFDKILPSDVNLRRIERNSFYKSIDYNCCYEAPIAKSIAPEESGAAYQTVMKMAEAAHKKDPSKTVAQHIPAMNLFVARTSASAMSQNPIRRL